MMGMVWLMNRKVSFLLLSILFFGTVSVWAGNVFVSESGISAEFFSSSGSEGISFNMSFSELVNGGYELVVEDGLIVGVSNESVGGDESADPFDGLISYYKLDETSGTIVADEIEFSNGARQTQVSINQNGLIGASYLFPTGETTGYVNLGTGFGDIGTADFSVNLFIKEASGSANMPVIFSEGVGGVSNIRLQKERRSGNDALFFTLLDSSSSNILYVGNTMSGSDDCRGTEASLSWAGDGQWHMITAQRVSDDIKLWIDGELVCSQSGFSNYDVDLSSYDAYLGAYNGNVQSWDGNIDEVGIWYRALSSSEINELWNNGDGLAYG